MKLPNRDNAFIPKNKILNYLLSDIHPVGKTKSKFFKMFGFHQNNIHLFEHALIDIAKTNDVKKEEISNRGKKYIIDGTCNTPIGKSISIRTIWILEDENSNPRFVTAYPIKS